MDTLIFIVSCLGVLGAAMMVAFILGRGSVMHDPYNFVQHHDEPGETKIAPAITRELAQRMWEEHVINQPTKEIRSIKL